MGHYNGNANAAFLTNLICWILVTGVAVALADAPDFPFPKLASHVASGGMGGLVMLLLIMIVSRNHDGP